MAHAPSPSFALPPASPHSLCAPISHSALRAPPTARVASRPPNPRRHRSPVNPPLLIPLRAPTRETRAPAPLPQLLPPRAPRENDPAPPRAPRKPQGYWSDRDNLLTELRAFLTRHALDTRMPTASDLRAARRPDLVRAIQQHGGFASLAKQLGLPTVRRRLPRGTHPLPHPLLPGIRAALRRLVESGAVPPGHLPAASRLRVLGETSLLSDISHAGGFHAVAAALDLLPARAPQPLSVCDATPEEGGGGGGGDAGAATRRRPRRERHYWRSWRNVETELRDFAAKFCDGCRPLQRQFIDARRTDLLNAVRQHGGLADVARRAGIPPPRGAVVRRPRGYWKDPAVLHAELATFTARHGYPGLMPRREQLMRAGRADIAYAIERHGGFPAVAAHLHLMWHGPSSYWRKFDNLQNRIMSYVAKTAATAATGSPPDPARKSKPRSKRRMRLHAKKALDAQAGLDVIPAVQSLHANGRLDLVWAIAMHGGLMNVAKRAGLHVQYKQRDAAYWAQPENIVREVAEVMRSQPLEARRFMPSSVTLVQIGRAELATAIRDHGGWLYYAQRLGLRFSFEARTHGFWRREDNVRTELLTYVEDRYGDWEHPGKPLSEWDRLQARSSGARFVPSLEMLNRDGRSDIANAIRLFHGGMHAFAERAGLRIADDIVEHRPVEELALWRRYAAQLELWVDAHGTLGVMPTARDLIRTGRHDLRYATLKHGGFETVARRLSFVLATGAPEDWLPQWLAMQAGNMALVMQMRARERISKREGVLLRKLERTLDSSGVGRARRLLTKTNVDIVHGDVTFKASSVLTPQPRAKSPRTLAGRVGKRMIKRRVTKLSGVELKQLRKRYSHLPPDDLIAV